MKSFKDLSPSITGPVKVMLSVSVPFKAEDQQSQLLIKIFISSHRHTHIILLSLMILNINKLDYQIDYSPELNILLEDKEKYEKVEKKRNEDGKQEQEQE